MRILDTITKQLAAEDQTCLPREIVLDLSLQLRCIPCWIEAWVAVDAACCVLG